MMRTRNNIVVEYKNRTIIGLKESIIVYGNDGLSKEVLAKIDTGATKSSIDITLASELKMGPIIETKVVKSASGTNLRPVINGEMEIANKKIKSEFTIADRSHMKYAVLIGLDILSGNHFLIDPDKK